MSDETTMRDLIARSSFGGHAWCETCKHPDLLHVDGVCHGNHVIVCPCARLQRMTPQQWLRWKDQSV